MVADNELCAAYVRACMWSKGAQQARQDAHLARYQGAHEHSIRNMEIAAVKSERHAAEAWAEYEQLKEGVERGSHV